MKNFATVQAAKRFCTTNKLGCHNPLIVAREGRFFVFLSGEPVGALEGGTFIRWDEAGYKKITRYSSCWAEWAAY